MNLTVSASFHGFQRGNKGYGIEDWMMEGGSCNVLDRFDENAIGNMGRPGGMSSLDTGSTSCVLHKQGICCCQRQRAIRPGIQIGYVESIERTAGKLLHAQSMAGRQ